MTKDSRHLSDAAQFSRILSRLQDDLQSLKEGDRANPDLAQLIRTLPHEIDAYAGSVDVGIYNPNDFSNYDGLSDGDILAEADSITPIRSWDAGDQAIPTDALCEWAARRLAPDASSDPAQLFSFGDAATPDHDPSDTTLGNRYASVPIAYSGETTASHGWYSDPTDDYRGVLYGIIDPGEFQGREITELAVTTQNEETTLLFADLADGNGDYYETNDLEAVIIRAEIGFRSSDAADRTTTQLCHRILGLHTIPGDYRISNPLHGSFGRDLFNDSEIDAGLDDLHTRVGTAPIADWDRDGTELRLLVYLDSAHFVDETLREVGLVSNDDGLLSYGPVDPPLEKTGLETVAMNIDVEVTHQSGS